MTFQEFVATRKWSEDIGCAIADERWAGEPPPKGWLYLGKLYIEMTDEHWPEVARTHGKWYLILNRDETVTDDLESLERKLYAWAMAEGYTLDEDGREPQCGY